MSLCTNATIDHCLWFIFQHEAELLNQVVENLMVAVKFQGHERIRLFALEKRTSISPLLFYTQEGCHTALI